MNKPLQFACWLVSGVVYFAALCGSPVAIALVIAMLVAGCVFFAWVAVYSKGDEEGYW